MSLTSDLTHVDQKNRPTMVNVKDKEWSFREARARSRVIVTEEIASLFKGDEIQTKKGPVFATAIIAGTMAVKKTSELIPFCHPLPIEGCQIDIHFDGREQILVECEVSTHYKTGVEMEALVGASVAALTIYDMCKAVSHKMVLSQTELLEKKGGKSDYCKNP